jgi:hypothetical protein
MQHAARSTPDGGGAALGYRMQPLFGMRSDELAGTSDENLLTTVKKLMSHVDQRRTHRACP